MKNQQYDFILQCIKPFRYWIIGQVCIGIIWAIDISLRPYLLKVLLNRMSCVDPEQAYTTLLWPAGTYIGLSACMVVVFRIYDFIWINVNAPLKNHIAAELIKRMMRHSHHFYQDQFAGNLGNKIKDIISGIADLLKACVNDYFAHSLAFIIAIVTLWSVNTQFAILFTIWLLIFIIVSQKLAFKAKKLRYEAAEVQSMVIGDVIDILTNVMNVRLFANQKEESTRFEKVLTLCRNAMQKRDWYFMKIFAFQGTSFVVYQAICLTWLISGFKNGFITPGDFALVLTINFSTIQILWSFSRDLIKFSESLSYVMQGLSTVLTPIEIQDKPDAQPLIVQHGEIIFDHVQFHYQDSTLLFKDESIVIKPGQRIGLVGYSGSGKSTFVNLILRLFDVTAGYITIDGQDIRNVTQDSLRGAISMIPQDPSLFHRTIMENIRYGKPDASDADVMQAAQYAHAHTFIQALPEGYNTMVGERGIKLSGGQRQRIAIARAFLKNAPILMLDEATSQLDSVTERSIQESLWKLMQGKTTIVIAHRLSTLLEMDRILVFDHGSIVQDGTHQELLAEGGLYATLWNAQVGGFLPEKENN
jgi:ATP-binding cassette subfamily B protein